MWFPTCLPTGREMWYLGSTQGNWPSSLPSSQRHETCGCSLYKPGWKAESRGCCPELWWGARSGESGGMSCVFQVLLVPAWASHVPLESQLNLAEVWTRTWEDQDRPTTQLQCLSCAAPGPTFCCLNDHPVGTLPGMLNTLPPEWAAHFILWAI